MVKFGVDAHENITTSEVLSIVHVLVKVVLSH